MTHTNTTKNFAFDRIVPTSDEVNKITRNWVITSAIVIHHWLFAGVERGFGFVLGKSGSHRGKNWGGIEK
jgi:hypothetical protein